MPAKKHCTPKSIIAIAKNYGISSPPPVNDPNFPYAKIIRNLVKLTLQKNISLAPPQKRRGLFSQLKRLFVKQKPTQLKQTSRTPVMPTKEARAEGLVKTMIQRRHAFKKATTTNLDEVAIETSLVADTLTPQAIKHWLATTNLINTHILKNPSCIEVKTSKGGAYTEDLYQVFYRKNCNPEGPNKLLFIIKVLSPDSAETELANINLLQNSPELRTLGNLRDPDYPQLTFSEKFYRFRTSNGQKRYLLIIHAAKGQSLYDIAKNGSPTLKVNAFKAFGHTLGNFNRRFLSGENCALKGGTSLSACRTINHGDLHPVNVFFDGKYIYLIDTETLAVSIRERTELLLDIIYFYNLPIYFWKFPKDTFTPYFNIAKKAYLKALTPNVQLQVALNNKITLWTNTLATYREFQEKMFRIFRPS
ncbi:MAG: hypothetical protein H6925_05140 [Holosporaceae bacterium]|nr:MAG: hypothetical protein H6925_05140 [Holosporaceae bacterium]